MRDMAKLQEEERKNVENQLQYMETKLSLVDDSAVMKIYISQQCEILRIKISELVNSESNRMDTKI